MTQTLLTEEALSLLQDRKNEKSEGRKKAKNGAGSVWAIVARDIGITESHLMRLISPNPRQQRGAGMKTSIKLSAYLGIPLERVVKND